MFRDLSVAEVLLLLVGVLLVILVVLVVIAALASDKDNPAEDVEQGDVPNLVAVCDDPSGVDFWYFADVKSRGSSRYSNSGIERMREDESALFCN